MARKNVVSENENLEEMAVNTLLEIMGNTQYVPEVRLAAAEKALRSLGKAEVPKSTTPQVVFNFGDHLAKTLMGVGTALELMRPAADQTAEPAGASDV